MHVKHFFCAISFHLSEFIMIFLFQLIIDSRQGFTTKQSNRRKKKNIIKSNPDIKKEEKQTSKNGKKIYAKLGHELSVP